MLSKTTSNAHPKRESSACIHYRGVPFARPPVDGLQFLPPQERLQWEAAFEASDDGPIAPQHPSRLAAVLGDFCRPQSEDCLTLTITAPAQTVDHLRPVVLFLHGGAYQAGAGSLEWYDGRHLAERGDLIVVSPNYQLGALGFMAANPVGKGRQGLDDMIAAVKWVSANAASFGGDPDNVTLMGQSAGAHAIMFMLTMPDVRRLFHRAILMSASADLAALSSEAAVRTLVEVRAELRNLGTDVAGPPEALLKASDAVTRRRRVFGDIAPLFLPVIDELADKQRLLEQAAEGAVTEGIDVLIGTTRDEAHAFFCAPSHRPPEPRLTTEAIERIAPAPVILDRCRAKRQGHDELVLLSDIVTETLFRQPSIRLAEMIAIRGGRAGTYQFNWAPASSRAGACHCIELPFVFGALDAWAGAPMLAGADRITLSQLSRSVQDTWIDFISRGSYPAAPIPTPGIAEGEPAVAFDALTIN